MSQHALVDNTLVREGAGIYAKCTCGWNSGARFSSMVASALFRDHLEQMGCPKKEPTPGDKP